MTAAGAPLKMEEAVVLGRIDAYMAAADYEGAVWWAERLRAHRPCEKHNLLVARCHLNSGNASRAFGILKHDREPQNRYFLAVAAFTMGKYHDAEIALVGSASEGKQAGDVPNGASGYSLLGRIFQRENRKDAAVESFRKSLQLDPCHWTSFDALCRLGAVSADTCGFFIPRPTSCAECEDEDSMELTSKVASTPFKATLAVSALSFSTPFSTPQTPSQVQKHDQNQNRNHINVGVDTPMSSMGTPVPRNAATPPVGGAPRKASPPPARRKAPPRPDREPRPIRRSERLSFSGAADPSELSSLDDRNLRSTARSRRSARLEKQRRIRSKPKTPSAASSRNAALPAASGIAAAASCPLEDRPSDQEGSPVKSAPCSKEPPPESLSSVVKILAEAHCLLYDFKCQESISLQQSLPARHHHTAFVMSSLGRAYFEMIKYEKAVEMFEMARKLEPHRVSGLEVYSTALWQLKRDVDLSYLAQHAIQMNRLAPESWIVVGNCFSLQKEHETALKFFQRAIQVDPTFAYAYTLCAHEYVANEDFDKALAGYRHAIRLDDRHYNAWYGLGNIYYRQEKYELAAYHFQRAISINSRSSVLDCYLGMVLHANRDYDGALRVLDRSCSLEPTNLLPKFQKANVYFSLNQLDMALAELEDVKDVAPREASVHFLMGKIYRKLGNIDQAMLHFTTCLDLDPKDKNLVKATIDKLHAPNDDSQSDDDF